MKIYTKNNKQNKKVSEVLSISKKEWQDIGLKMNWIRLVSQVSKERRGDIETQIDFDMSILSDICEESQKAGLTGESLANDIKNKWISKIEERVNTVDIPANFILPENKEEVIRNESNKVRDIPFSPSASNQEIISTIIREIHKIRRQQIDTDYQVPEEEKTLMNAIQNIQDFKLDEDEEEIDEDFSSVPAEDRAKLKRELSYANEELKQIRNRAEELGFSGKQFFDFVKNEWIKSVERKRLPEPSSELGKADWVESNNKINEEIQKVSQISIPENLSNDEVFNNFKNRIKSILLPFEQTKVPIEKPKTEIQEETEDLEKTKRVISDEKIQEEANRFNSMLEKDMPKETKKAILNEFTLIYEGYSDYKQGLDLREETIKRPGKKDYQKYVNEKTDDFFDDSPIGGFLKGMFRRSGNVQWARGDFGKLLTLVSAQKVANHQARQVSATSTKLR